MRAVILAAGRGGRLRPVLGDRPKCLGTAGDCTLLERQIRTLRACGIEEITVVVGYRAQDVRRVCGRGVETVHNPRFASTNSLYSLWLASDLLRDGFVVLNCDVLFHPQLLRDLLSSRYEDALLFCPRAGSAPYGDEEMKVTVRRGLVTAIDKGLSEDDADGENVGIAKFSARGAARLVAQMTSIVSSGALREWLPRVFATFALTRELHAIETRGYPWIEIDFPEDYWRACREVLPAIEADAHGLPSAVARGVAPARSAIHHV
jgi:choline kinase